MESIVVIIFLTFIEVVLGVDNILMITIIADKFSITEHKKLVRIIGLFLSMIFRLVMLFFIGIIISAYDNVWSWGVFSFSYKDMIFILGGVFLLYKGVSELYFMLTSCKHITKEQSNHSSLNKYSLLKAIVEVIFVDLVFSLDSLITAIGITENYILIGCSIVLSLSIFLILSSLITVIINKNKRIKVLTLSFVVLIGGYLVVDGFGAEISKVALYSMIGFALIVEILNSLHTK